MVKHTNNGRCEKCAEIFDKYPGFHAGLRDWFTEFQAKFPNSHISCAGRGREDQEACVKAGTSRAHFGQSAHNFNAAIDVFWIVQGDLSYDRTLYTGTIPPNLPGVFKWYGAPGASFPELPHIEVAGWANMNLKPVESLT